MRSAALLALAAGLFALPVRSAPDAAPKLAFPVACVIGQTCEVQNYVDRDPGPDAKDYRCGTSTYQDHSGIDIRIRDLAAQRAGVNVLAAAPGRVSRLRDGVADVSVTTTGREAVSGQECGNGVVIDHGGGWETQYCHLAQGSVKVKVGDTVATGQPIARIGLSGLTQYPHLHITVRQGARTIDPFAPGAAAGSCDRSASSAGGLWTPAAAAAMSYKPGAVLSAGFTGAAVTLQQVEAGGLGPAGPDTPYLVAYALAINLAQGDRLTLVLKAPDGQVLAQTSLPPLDHSKAEYMTLVGKRRPAAGWPPGTYAAVYSVTRNGKVVVSRDWRIRL